ncbi:FAD-dependent oxidoreductase [Roseburia hominis]
MRKADYLILGNGIAGLSAAGAVRGEDKDARILIVTREKWPTYVRPLLSKAGLKLADFDVLHMVDEAWHKENRIELVRNMTAEEIDVKNHVIRCATDKIEYGKCIYALGGDAWLPPVKGRNFPGIFVLRNIEDMQAIKRWALRAGRVVVIGGGVIGMEIGEALYRHKMQVTVLENQPRILPRVLDEETAEEYVMRLNQVCKGTQGNLMVRTNVNVAEILGEDCVTGVRLADGEVLDCDMVIFSCGIRSCTELASRAGIEVERAVVVDEYMRTSAEDIYACGDCAQFRGNCAALWKPAMEQGRIAGLAACGVYEKYRPQKFPVLCNSSLVSLFAVGDLAIFGEEGYRIEVSDNRKDSGAAMSNGEEGCVAGRVRKEMEKIAVMPRETGTYKRLVYRGDRLVGAALVGNLSEMQALREKMADEEGSYE